MDDSMIIGIIGSRHFGKEQDDIDASRFIAHFITGIDNYAPLFSKEVTIISGGAIGTDTFVENVCRARHMEFMKVLPNFKKYGKPKAYHERNDEIITMADFKV